MQSEMEGIEGSPLGGQTDMLRDLYSAKVRSGKKDPALDKKLVSLVLDHAKKVIAHPSRPKIDRIESYLRAPFDEIDIEESLEESPFLEDSADLRVCVSEEKHFSCVAMLDSSSSMSGEKHLLASIAIAVLLLKVRPQDASVVVFSSDAIAMKRMGTDDAPQSTILRFLKSQPRGFTNIRKGLQEGVAQLKRQGKSRRKLGLIATDGRSTEGGDPAEIAKLFDSLIVLHLHGPGSHLESSVELAQRGNGVCLEVERMEELPRRLYDAIRLLARC